MVKDYAGHKFPGGQTVTLGLAENGVGLSPMTHTKALIPAEDLKKVEEIKKKILSGEIKVVDVSGPDGYRLGSSKPVVR